MHTESSKGKEIRITVVGYFEIRRNTKSPPPSTTTSKINIISMCIG
jgi:hypothetical protein